MPKSVSHAVAKVNLMLNITRKTDDNYHQLESVFAFLEDVYDELIFYPEVEFNDNSAKISGVYINSIKTAAGILKNYFGLKVPHVVVSKKLPISGGVGGGSSDAACFVNTVFDLWRFSESEKLKYINLFGELGADAKVFLYKYFTNSRFIYINGAGLSGDISPINLDIKDEYILIVNNGTKLSTKDVFQNFRGSFLKKLGREKINFNHLKNFHNSLHSPAIELEPSLQSTMDDIKSTKPIFCGISGSGTTCFGLYEEKKLAEIAKNNLLKYPLVEISKL